MHMADILINEWRGQFMPEFVASLPILAIDGTMKKRLLATEISGNGHIKTGTLDGVRSRWRAMFATRLAKSSSWFYLLIYPRAGMEEAWKTPYLRWVYEGAARK